jgi:DNA-binding XRE family transcriptional regulator
MGKGKALLRVLRASHEPSLTQTTLARKAGLKRLRYWAIENGEVEPNADEMEAIAVALNVKRSEIAWPSNALKRTA